MNEIDWFRMRFGQDGVRSDPIKIQHLSTHYNNRNKAAPLRVDRHRQKLSEFDYVMKHIPGKQMPCD